MAEWLSSKLKEAEQFLHQIDQQAAESLGKPEKQKPRVLSEGRQGTLHGKVKQTSDLPYANRKDILRQDLSGGNPEIGSQPAPSALSKLTRKSNHGTKALNSNAVSEVKDLRPFKKKELGSVLQSAENSESNVRRDDWTELLASPNIDLVSSPALASSVGSSDSGRTGFTMGASSRLASNAGKNEGGRLLQSNGFPSRNSSQLNHYPQVPSPTSKVKPSMRLFDTGLMESSKAISPWRFRDETLRRRLELDLAGVDGDAEGGVIKDAASAATAKDTGTNGHSIDTNDAMTRRMPDFGVSKHVLQGVVEEADREDGAGETTLLERERERYSKEWEQMPGTSPGSASERTDHFAIMDPNLNLANESEPEDFRSLSHPTGLNESKAAFEVNEEVNELKEHAKSSIKSSIENGESLFSLVSQVEQHNQKAEGRELVAGEEVVQLEELPETKVLPASLESDVESYESGSVTETESDRETESEEDEIERRKSAHKKRIARRKELAAIRVATAQAAIREREIFVEKLEKEVVTLKRVLAEREEQQNREAAELRLSITEVLHALESEKKLHNSTRMEALAEESQLENQNADLAKSLGALQWELEEQMSQVLKARNILEAKEAIKAELERSLAKIRHDTCHSQQNNESKLAGKSNDEDFSFEEEQSDLWKNIQQCQIQVKDLELKIHGLKVSRHAPTQTEMELESHLVQLTDHLIQKQAQVEALSSEKATLLIRLEAISNAIEEERAMASSQASRNKMGFRKNFDWDPYYDDMEHGFSRSYDSKTKSFTYHVGKSSTTVGSMGSQTLSPVLRQLNTVFSAGIFYLRRHRWAQAFTVVYIISLHLWVFFVLFMNSKPSQQTLALHLPKNDGELNNSSNITNLL